MPTRENTDVRRTAPGSSWRARLGLEIAPALPYVRPRRNLSHDGASSSEASTDVRLPSRLAREHYAGSPSQTPSTVYPRLESQGHDHRRILENSSAPSQLRMRSNLSHNGASTSNQNDQLPSNSNVRLWSDELQQENSQAPTQTPALNDQVILDAILSGITRHQLDFKLLADVVYLLDQLAKSENIDDYQTFSGITITEATLFHMLDHKDIFKEMYIQIEEKLNQLKCLLEMPETSHAWHNYLDGKIPSLEFLNDAYLCLSEGSLRQAQELLIPPPPPSSTVLVLHPPRRTESGNLYDDVYTMGKREDEAS